MYANFNKLNDQIQKERIKAFKKYDLEVKKAYFLVKNTQFQLIKKNLLVLKIITSQKR